MILRRFIYYCGKFHTDTIDQTVFGKEFVKLVWGNENYFEPPYIPQFSKLRALRKRFDG